MLADSALPWATEVAVDKNRFYYVNMNWRFRFVKYTILLFTLMQVAFIVSYFDFRRHVKGESLTGFILYSEIAFFIASIIVTALICFGMQGDLWHTKDFEDAKRFNWEEKQMQWGCKTEFIRFPKNPLNGYLTKIGKDYSE